MILDLQLIAYFYVKHDGKLTRQIPDMVKMICEQKLTIICTSKNQYYYPHIKYCDKSCIRYLYEELRVKFRKTDFENLCRIGNKSMLKYIITSKPEFIDSHCIKVIVEEGVYSKYLLIEPYILPKRIDIFDLLINSMYNDQIFIRLFGLYNKTGNNIHDNNVRLVYTAIRSENISIISFLYSVFPEQFSQIDLISIFKTKLEVVEFIADKIDPDKIKTSLSQTLLEIAINYNSIGKLRIILEWMNKFDYDNMYDNMYDNCIDDNDEHDIRKDIIHNYLSDLLQNNIISSYEITPKHPTKNKSYITNAITYAISTSKSLCVQYLLSK